ncbi:hypothetical protein SLEP1_g60285 [Rubroshorea leprosula]|uniref:Uncharacterized protein n=1 Tax=Rubroshorea leprosula TaxID=152421 RepID=A0AAV5MVD1_9ROSI|nr:hypothetical protein SLEP1_g60285 [Rubroshorea leprosula]
MLTGPRGVGDPFPIPVPANHGDGNSREDFLREADFASRPRFPRGTGIPAGIPIRHQLTSNSSSNSSKADGLGCSVAVATAAAGSGGGSSSSSSSSRWVRQQQQMAPTTAAEHMALAV